MKHSSPIVCVLGLLLCQAGSIAAQATPQAHRTIPVVSAAEAPPGCEKLAVQWVKVVGPEHGSHGFARQYVRLAQDLAHGGVIAVAACWFSPGVGAGLRFVTPISCPDAPSMPNASDPAALQSVDVLVRAVRTLPGVRANRIGLFGHSRGAGAALNYALSGANQVQAVVLNSGGYPNEIAGRAREVKAPLLILHGAADGAADGGSAVTDVQMARRFEAALRRAGRPVEAMYYDGAGHNGIFSNASQYDDEVKRIIAFLGHHLAN
jgi:alpha-beta hydrolase superfamily lysophospholipase